MFESGLIFQMIRRAQASVMIAASLSFSAAVPPALAADTLIGRAVLPAATFAPGPTSGQQLGTAPINGQAVPFLNKQLVQGFSAVSYAGKGRFWVMADNGFGAMENSSDFNLRVYKINPDFETAQGGSGTIKVESFIELHDPDEKIPFTIANHFSEKRVLTGADFDIESMQRADDGSLWFGDEFGPYLLHTDKRGKVLEAPIRLPEFKNPGTEVRSPQNQFNEEASAVRIMNAARNHARRHGGKKVPVFSPNDLLLEDGNAGTLVANRQAPAAGSGLKAASSEIFNVASIKNAGYQVVTWTVNDKARMLELMKLGVNGIISDRPDLLRQAVQEFDANNDGVAGDYLNADGLVDLTKFDAQGHRGGRSLRPENTLPAMEVGLDNLMATLETDTGISADLVPLLDHDPYIEAAKCRLASGLPYTLVNQVLVMHQTVAQIQSKTSGFICDKLLPDRPDQKNDLTLSPVAVAFAANKSVHPYVKPTVQQLFEFVEFYADYYKTGAGKNHAEATKRWINAERVRFNIETKINPRKDVDFNGTRFKDRTVGPKAFAKALAEVIVDNHMAERADIQSFDFRTLLVVQEKYPEIRTVYLFGDFPIYDDVLIAGSNDGTNLQDEHGKNTPWMAGMFWPYRSTKLTQPTRAQRSGGFEGMALTSDGKRLLPLLELPLTGDDAKTLIIHEFDLRQRKYTGKQYFYKLEARGTNIGDFIMYNDNKGLVIEREGSQGDLNGFKAIFEIELQGNGQLVKKNQKVDLLKIKDPAGISLPAAAGDVGLGSDFAFPFTTIEDVIVFDREHIGVLNDNNFPFSVGRHVGSGRPDDNEFIIIKLDKPLDILAADRGHDDHDENQHDDD